MHTVQQPYYKHIPKFEISWTIEREKVCSGASIFYTKLQSPKHAQQITVEALY